MEIEVKIRLTEEQDYAKTVELLSKSANFVSQDDQTNYFFDNDAGDLCAVRANFRLRKIANPESFLITFKSKGTLVDGIARIQEVQDVVSKADFMKILDDPSSLHLFSHIPVVEHFLKLFDTQTFHQTASFANMRLIYQWEDCCLEVDQTNYPFGTFWYALINSREIECEHVDPENVKKRLHLLLAENMINFTDAKRSKFGNLLAGSVL